MRVPQATGQQFAGREQERLVEFRCARILLFSHWFGVSLTRPLSRPKARACNAGFFLYGRFIPRWPSPAWPSWPWPGG